MSAKPVGENDCFNSLCRIEAVDSTQLTPRSARRIAVALAEIRRVSPTVTPQEIQLRADRFRSAFPTWALTVQLLAMQWARLGNTSSAPPVARAAGEWVRRGSNEAALSGVEPCLRHVQRLADLVESCLPPSRAAAFHRRRTTLEREALQPRNQSPLAAYGAVDRLYRLALREGHKLSAIARQHIVEQFEAYSEQWESVWRKSVGKEQV